MMLVFEPDSLKKYKNLLHIFGALDKTRSRVISSVGRALRLHRRCREFESLITHHYELVFMCAVVAQLVRVPACHAGGRGFEPRQPRQS